ncbi:hypothetical protein J1N35_001140 [Gossypium stocksii]|uniref:Uncharacterized protein n=1 Tax=Gossypium stocksii TaxID=47602 RepID=A0A9D3WH38_9ROSI|nr:hypothetical protein J1N35_001140 [Gossypium stocksii]
MLLSWAKRENHKQWSDMITRVTVQGKEVPITPQEICQYYDAPYYIHDHLETINLFTFENFDIAGIIDDLFMSENFDMAGIIDYLTEGYGEWSRQANSKVPLKFNTTIMFLMA